MAKRAFVRPPQTITIGMLPTPWGRGVIASDVFTFPSQLCTYNKRDYVQPRATDTDEESGINAVSLRWLFPAAMFLLGVACSNDAGR